MFVPSSSHSFSSSLPLLFHFASTFQLPHSLPLSHSCSLLLSSFLPPFLIVFHSLLLRSRLFAFSIVLSSPCFYYSLFVFTVLPYLLPLLFLLPLVSSPSPYLLLSPSFLLIYSPICSNIFIFIHSPLLPFLPHSFFSHLVFVPSSFPSYSSPFFRLYPFPRFILQRPFSFYSPILFLPLPCFFFIPSPLLLSLPFSLSFSYPLHYLSPSTPSLSLFFSPFLVLPTFLHSIAPYLSFLSLPFPTSS